MKRVEYNTTFSTNLDVKNGSDSKVFSKLDELWGSLKESKSKVDLSQQSTFSIESILTIISSLEANLKAKLAPLLKFVHVMPTNAPPVKPVVQGEDRGVGASKNSDQGKFVGKVITTQILISLPVSLTTTSTTTTSRPLNKGIVIGQAAIFTSQPSPAPNHLISLPLVLVVAPSAGDIVNHQEPSIAAAIRCQRRCETLFDDELGVAGRWKLVVIVPPSSNGVPTLSISSYVVLSRAAAASIGGSFISASVYHRK
ncbi:unnamed protein product [Lactuca virosa]|uniref:Uncharacterized protein n=1 Tax=Lactuca virosa TaxID=75947 RepID=A0AAU9N5S1_9ASTR|nr:unnamed protein product [Lactuca virosa]